MEKKKNLKLDLIFKVAPIIISIIAIVVSVYSYSLQSTRNQIMIEKHLDDLSPTIKCRIDTAENRIIFESIEDNRVVQGGTIVFPASITEEIFNYSENDFLNKNQIESIINKYVETKINLSSKKGTESLVKLPIPIIHNYNASAKGKVLDLRNLSMLIYLISVSDDGQVTGYEIDNIYLDQKVGIPIKSHLFMKNPFKSDVPWGKVLRQDSIDVREILEQRLEYSVSDIRNRLKK